MARRYRYAIIKKKEAAKGKLSVGLAIASLLLFGGAVGIAYVLEGSYGFIVGGICLFAALLSVYGFLDVYKRQLLQRIIRWLRFCVHWEIRNPCCIF